MLLMFYSHNIRVVIFLLNMVLLMLLLQLEVKLLKEKICSLLLQEMINLIMDMLISILELCNGIIMVNILISQVIKSLRLNYKLVNSPDSKNQDSILHCIIISNSSPVRLLQACIFKVFVLIPHQFNHLDHLILQRVKDV